MFPNLMMNPWISFQQSEHAKLVENYQNVTLQVTYLREIIKNLEDTIQELQNKQEIRQIKGNKKCRFYNTGFCRSRENCPFKHPENSCKEHLETGKCSSYRTCQERHPRKCRHFETEKSCFYAVSCAYLHKEIVDVEEDSDNDETVSNAAKKITIEVNGKHITVEKFEDLDEETTNSMTADDFLKFCDDFHIEKTSDAEEFVDIDEIEKELRESIYLNATNDFTNTNPKTVEPKDIKIKKSTRKKSTSVRK